jgi:hypothetical protein
MNDCGAWLPRARYLELRKAIKLVNRTLAELKVAKHPDKTTIVCILRGFDFLGFHFAPAGLPPAHTTIERRNGPACRATVSPHADEPRTTNQPGPATHPGTKWDAAPDLGLPPLLWLSCL